MRRVDRRVAEVYGKRANGKTDAVSGYLVGSDLILTCAHGLEDADVLEVRLAGDPRSWAAEPAWTRHESVGTGNDGVDAAVIRIVDPDWTAPAGLPPLRWGRLAGPGPAVAVTATGFPAGMKAYADGRLKYRDTAQISGKLSPGTRTKGKRFEIFVENPVPSVDPGKPGGKASRWTGMSGAAVVTDVLVLGVAVVDPDPSSGTALTAVPVDEFADDPGFQALVGEIRLEPVELLPLLQEAAARPVRSPLGLLRPESGVVPFHGREGKLDELTAWCRTDSFPLRLLTGAGGEGKTRLAREFVRRMRDDGWFGGFAGEQVPGSELAVLRGVADPVVLVVDYAETRVEQVASMVDELNRLVLDTPSAPGEQAAGPESQASRIKILLLARSSGEWWNHLRTRSLLLRDVPASVVSRLEPLEPDAAVRPTAFRAAVEAVAARLAQVPGFEAVPMPDPASVKAPRVGADRFANALNLQTEAVVAVLQAAAPIDSPDSAPPVDTLLLHERRFWEQTAVRHKVQDLHADTQLQIIAAATLCPARDARQASQILTGLKALRGQTANTATGIAAWVADMYPGRDSHWRALQPDLIGEHLVGSATAQNPELLRDLLPVMDEAQARHALQVMARSGESRPHVAALLSDSAPEWPAAVAWAAVETATQVEYPGSLIAALEAIVQAPSSDPDLLGGMLRRTPKDTVVLRQWSVELARRLTDSYGLDGEPDPAVENVERSTALVELAFRLARAGRPTEALASARMAYEELSPYGDSPDHQLAFTRAALGYAARLSGVGRSGEAVVHAEEALAVLQRLQQLPGADLHAELARCLHQLAILCFKNGHADQAATRAREALDIRRVLIGVPQGGRSPELASTLTNHAAFLERSGQADDALGAAAEAVDIYRNLVEAMPDAWRPALVTALMNKATCLRSLKRLAEAAEAAAEAMTLARALVLDDAGAHRAALAMALNNYANHLVDLARAAEAVRFGREAVDLCRELAAENPGAHLGNLALFLNNQANHLADVGLVTEPLAMMHEAVELYRRLAADLPSVYGEELAMALRNHAKLTRPA